MVDSTPQTPSELVAWMKSRGVIHDARIEDAFLKVPREPFLPNVPLEQIYLDEAIPIKRDPEGQVISSSSQPSMMALMLEQLEVKEGQNILEIGTGSGYNAAIMHHLVGKNGRVTTIEYDPDVAEQAVRNLQKLTLSEVMVVRGDGALGFAPRASYDRIIATVGIWDVPHAWIRQLKPRGILVTPIWLDTLQISAAFRLQPDDTLLSHSNQMCAFVRLRGTAAGPDVRVKIGRSLYLHTNYIERIDTASLHMLLSEYPEEGYLGEFFRSSDFFNGFIPYLAMNVESPSLFVTYYTADDQQPYGLQESGFALLNVGSACFVPMRGEGKAYSFGSADSLMVLQDHLSAWRAVGKPFTDRLRLKLHPMNRVLPEIEIGRWFKRSDHAVHAWYEEETTR